METGSIPLRTDEAQSFKSGFVSMLPLWAGAIPSGIAFGVAAQSAGFDSGEAQLMSLVVFSSAAQMSAVADRGMDQPFLVLILTAVALNAHIPLLGAVINERCAPRRRQRPVIAWFLTDGALGVAAARGRLLLPVLLGAGVSMYLAWNTGTAIGLVSGNVIPASARTGLDLVVPMTFLAVLVPMLTSSATLTIAVVSGVTALAASQVVPAGIAVLAAGLVGVFLQDRRSSDE